MIIEKLNNLESDDSYFEEISTNVWITDNHKWAFYVWEKYLADNGLQKIGLVHIDYHYDSVDDISDTGLEDEVKDWTLEEIKIQTESGNSGPIRWDSFIAPFIYRGRVLWIKWLCFDEEDEPGFLIAPEAMPKVVENFYDSSGQLSQHTFGDPYILDICLDYFSTEGDGIENRPRENTFVDSVLADCEVVIANAALITVSLSFASFNTAEDVKVLAKRIIPRILQICA